MVLKDGDIVSVDCGTFKNGFVGDSAYTFAVGEISDEVKLLLETTKESLFKGIEQAVEGRRLGECTKLLRCLIMVVVVEVLC